MCPLQQSTHGAVQFAVYEELKYFASRISRSPAAAGSSGKGPAEKSTDKGRTLGSAELSLFAAASKLSASIFTYPTQVSLLLLAPLAECMGSDTLSGPSAMLLPHAYEYSVI